MEQGTTLSDDAQNGQKPKPIVSLVNVTGGYVGKPVFNRTSLNLYPGQLTGIIGPTGGGKTTLLKVILGVNPALSGEVYLFGNKVQGKISGGIGYVPQVETVDWNFPVTVEQVAMMGQLRQSSIWPWPSPKERKRSSEVLERLGLKDFSKRHIRALSGGQQQRTFLARALLSQPKLLILDEPTSGVDIKTQHDILDLLHDLSLDGMTILLTTHDLNSVATHLSRVICFNKTVIADGSPENVFTPEIFKKTFQADMLFIRDQDSILVTQATPLSFRRTKIGITRE